MGITLVHYFHAQSCSVEDVGPSRDDTVLTIGNRLVEVEYVEVECHCRNAKGSKPDTDNRPSSKEEV